MTEIFGSDAYSPNQVAERIENIGMVKARLPVLSTVMLGLLGGGFIGLGAGFFTIVTSDLTLGFAAARTLGGVVFSMGLILVTIAGAELFTGNNLLVMAYVSRKISLRELATNWLLVFFANLVGAGGIAMIVALSGHAQMNGGLVGLQMVKIAAAKSALSFPEAFFKGVLCNILVCLAVWTASAGRTIVDKSAAIVLPIAAFVAAGFEHCVANMYFVPLGILVKNKIAIPSTLDLSQLTWLGFIQSLVPVTLGNIVGGSGMIALTYYVIYRRNRV